MKYYPAFLNLKGKHLLLFGGGEVAFRKAKIFAETGAKITAVSKEFSPAFKKLAQKRHIKLIYGSKIPSLKNIWLVVAGTSDPKFNREIFKACEKNRIFVNVVDDPKNCNFIVPSIVKRGLLQIAISTGGASPHVAKTIRKELEARFGPEYIPLLKKLARERQKVKDSMTPKERMKYFKRRAELELAEMRSK